MTRFFTGMPAPAAAGVVMVPMMLTFATGQTWPQAWWLNALVLVSVALMMVSTVPTFSIKMITTRVKPRYMLPVLVGIGAIIVALVNVPWWTLLAVAFLYLSSLPIGVLVARNLAAQADAQEAEAQTAGGKPEFFDDEPETAGATPGEAKAASAGVRLVKANRDDTD